MIELERSQRKAVADENAQASLRSHDYRLSMPVSPQSTRTDVDSLLRDSRLREGLNPRMTLLAWG